MQAGFQPKMPMYPCPNCPFMTPGQLPMMPGQSPMIPGQFPMMPGQSPMIPGQFPMMSGQLPMLPYMPGMYMMPGQYPMSMPYMGAPGAGVPRSEEEQGKVNTETEGQIGKPGSDPAYMGNFNQNPYAVPGQYRIAPLLLPLLLAAPLFFRPPYPPPPPPFYYYNYYFYR